MSDKNALGLIFKVDRLVGRGDTIDIISDLPDGSLIKRQFHHEFCDGLGALLLSSQDWKGSQLRLPARRIQVKKLSAQILSGLQGFLDDLKPRQTKWNAYDDTEPYRPDFIARRVFSFETSKLITETARHAGVSVTALMLWHVNSVICNSLISAETTHCHWVLPINMRRPRGEETRIENRISSVGLHFERDTDLRKLGQIYTHSLNPVHAFANEFLTEILALMGEKKLLELAKSRGKANSWTGIFTNLGQWDFPDLPEDSHWPVAVSITPPGGTSVLPIGVGMMTWRGHLSLSLRLHPGLAAKNHALPEMLLDGVRQSLKQSLGIEAQLLRG